MTHSSLHTGIKPYQCQCCGNQFSCIGNLIKHRKIRPQTCGLPQYTNIKCAPRASTKGNLFFLFLNQCISFRRLNFHSTFSSGQFDNKKREFSETSLCKAKNRERARITVCTR